LESLGLRHRADRVRAELVAESGVELAIRTLKDDLMLPAPPWEQNLETRRDPWHVLSRTSLQLVDGVQLRVRVRDMGARINLNGLLDDSGEPLPETRDFLRAAIRRVISNLPGRAEDKPYKHEKIADGILDWIDSGGRTRLGDAEDAFYRQRGARIPPVNRRLVALSELAEVPGIDQRLLDALRHYFTVHVSYATIDEAGINPNTAPPWVMGLIYMGAGNRFHFLEVRDVFAALRARGRGRIFCPSSTEDPCVRFQSVVGQVGEVAFPPLAFHDRAFEIESIAEIGDIRACVRTAVERRGPQNARTLSHDTECP
jgi:type II secretory pathway component PulK